jgi:hypothetical protein
VSLPYLARALSPNSRRSAIDGRTARQAVYAVSQRIRKRIEERFGWQFALTAAACTLIRPPKP